MSQDRPLWGDPTTTDELMDRARDFALEYRQTVRARSVYPTDDSLQRLEKLGGAFPEESTNPLEVLELLHRDGSPASVAQTGGRYFGFVDGGALPIGVAARWLSDTWDQNAAHYVMSPVNSQLEEVCERWLVDLLRLPDGSAAGFETGTTLANFSGLCAGRNAVLKRLGWDVNRQGLFGAPKLRIIAGQAAHAAVQKSVSMLGMGTDCIEIVPQDDQGRFDASKMPKIEEPVLVVTQAGNVNSGAFDPIGEICDRVAGTGSWVHVDGAFGLWARAVPGLDEHTEGWDKADSWAADAHKTLNVPYDSGIVLCRDRNALTGAFEASASYLQWSAQRDPMRYTPSMSKRARAVELWAVLKTLGRRGVIELVEQLCARTRSFATKLGAAGFDVVHDVVFNQVMVACGTDASTEQTVANLQAGGECWCGGSQWNGRSVIRISVCDWSTTEADVDRTVAAFVDARVDAEAT